MTLHSRLLLVCLMAVAGTCLQADSLVRECETPQLFEYISNFTLPLKDIKALVSKQLSNVNLSNISNGNANITDINYSVRLLSDEESVTYNTPLNASVSNKQLQFSFGYSASIKGLTSSKKVKATTVIDGLSIAYAKAFSVSEGKSEFEYVSVNFQPGMLKTQVNESLSSSQAEKFYSAVNGTTNSLFASFASILKDSNIKDYLVENAKSEHLSKIYDQNPYAYSFYNYSMNVDVSTVTISTEEISNTTTDLINGISGALPVTTACSEFTPNFTGTGANMFISYELIQNAVDSSIKNYDSWKDALYSKEHNSRFVPILQFMVADHEFIVDGLIENLGDSLFRPVEYRCRASKNAGGQISSSNNVMYQSLTWHCQAVALLNETQETVFMDFEPTLSHPVSFRASQTLTVYTGAPSLVDCVFN